MKTISNLIMAIAFIAGLTSCAGDYQDWSAPQSNPQESQYSIPGMTAKGTNSVIELKSTPDITTVGTLDVPTLPEGFSVKKIDLNLTDIDEQFANVTTEAIVSGNQLQVTKDKLVNTVQDFYGKRPVERVVLCNVIATISNGKEATEVNCGTINITAVPDPSKFVNDYYAVGALNNWNDPNNKSCYFIPESDDVFTYTTKWTGDHNLKIWNGEDYGNWDVAYGSAINNDPSPSGALVNSKAGAIKAPTGDEYYTLKCNMKALTYEWVKLANQSPASYDKIGLIGVGGDWNNDIFMEKVTEGNYRIEVTLPEGEFKFRANADWAANWGSGVPVDKSFYGVCTQDGGNIWAPAGKYIIYFNSITGAYAALQQ